MFNQQKKDKKSISYSLLFVFNKGFDDADFLQRGVFLIGLDFLDF